MSAWSRLWDILNTEITPRDPRPKRTRRRWRARVPFAGAIDATFFRKRSKLRVQWTVFNQLNIILKANAALVPGIGAAIYDAPSGNLARILHNLKRRIESGMSLSEAMRAQPEFFPARACDLVQAGEISGQPAGAMHTIIMEWEERISRRSSVSLIVSYAFFLFAVQASIIGYLLMKVVPVFVEVVRDYEGTSPATIETAQWAWQFVDTHRIGVGVGIAMLIGSCIVGGWAYRRVATMQVALASTTRRVPIVGRFIALQNLAHAAQLLQRLIDGGVPLPAALDRVGDSAMNAGYAGVFARLAERVERGASLGDALETERYYLPASFRALLSLGENAAAVPEACGNIGHVYAAELDRTRRVLASALVPAVALVAGSITLYACWGVYGILIALADGIMGTL